MTMKLRIALHWQMLVALVLGGLCGWVFRDSFSTWGEYVDFVGKVFLYAINQIVLPLIFITSFLSLSTINEVKSMGRIAIKTFTYFIVTAVIAALVGIIITTIFQFGVSENTGMVVSDSISTDGPIAKSWKMLYIVLVALVLGMITSLCPSRYRQPINVFGTLFYDLFTRVATFFVRVAPIAIFAIVMRMVAQNAGHIEENFKKMLFFVIAVWAALLVMACIILPLIVALKAHISPWKHFKKMAPSLLVAFSTCSSCSSLPFLLSDVKDKCGVSNRVAGFTIPLGFTFNKVGTIIYECVAVVFVAQACGVVLTIDQTLTLLGAAILTSLGTPAVPMGGVLVLGGLLSTMSLPTDSVALFMTVDVLCDMPKTLLNAYSNSCGTIIVAQSEREELMQ